MPEALDLVQLRSFIAIADCGGFGRAATALHVSQPTISQHVRLLERRLKQPLVRRVGRNAVLTEAGERLLAEARHLLAVHDQALERLVADTQSRLVIGSTETAAEQVLPGLLAALRDAYPDSSVQFYIDRSTQMTDAVLKGSIDLAVILGLDANTPGRQVGTLPLQWYASPHWSRVPGRVPLVAYVEPCGMRQQAFRELGDAGIQVEVVAESTSLEGVLAAARAGLGVAVLPSAGAVPSGLVECRDLPDLGMIGVFLATRRGLGLELEATALGVLEWFFGERAVDARAEQHPEALAVDLLTSDQY